MPEQDQLRAAVVGLGVSQNIDRVGDDEFVAVLVSEMPELFELLIGAVSAVIVEEYVVSVRIEETRERNVSLVMLRHAVQHHNRAFDLCGIRIIGINGGLVLIILCQHNLIDRHVSLLCHDPAKPVFLSLFLILSLQILICNLKSF